ncbi:MAG: iron-containing alcohol dehydrogenase [Eubacterium sp.]|nr:iron-containing alcohol dehydrogenase [Eubacterium sp.]
MADQRLIYADPRDLDTLRTALKDNDPDGKLCPILMDRIYIQKNAIELLPEIILEHAKGKKILMVTDMTPYYRGEESLKEQVYYLLNQKFEVFWLTLDNHDHVLHALDEESLRIQEAIRDHQVDCVLGIGGGTITDLCKDASYAVDDTMPLVIVQTALSVNAFSDGISIMLKNGVKVSLPTRYPSVLVIDLDVIEQAPMERNLAGYGDVMATWTAPVDWYLAYKLGMNNTYNEPSCDILRTQNSDLLEQSAHLAEKDPKAFELLARVLTLSGLAMGIAGESCPSSGTEHIITHLLDMAADKQDRDVAFHGAQVSIGTIFTAIAWDILLNEFDPTDVDIDKCFPTEEQMKPMVYKAFEWIKKETADECWKGYQKKLESWKANRKQFERFLDEWDSIKAEIEKVVVSPEHLCEQMRAAGAPTHYSQMTPPIDEKTARWALLDCHLYRNRFTLSDLLFYLGWWNQEFIERLIQRAAALDAGL